MNFAEFPIDLAHRPSPPAARPACSSRIRSTTTRRKKLITRKRIIEGSEEYGLPTATDDMVILALIQLTKLKNDFSRREVEFTRLELIRLLGWPDKGQSYDRIETSLLRIASVTYNYDNAWWDGRRKTWTTKVFGIIDTVEINDSRERRRAGRAVPLPHRLERGRLRQLPGRLSAEHRLPALHELQAPIGLRMYRFLGKRFYLQPEWMFDLKEFAYEHIGLGRNYEGGTQIARKLRPAIIGTGNGRFPGAAARRRNGSSRKAGSGRSASSRRPRHACPPSLAPPTARRRRRRWSPSWPAWRDQGDGGRAGAAAPGRADRGQAGGVRLADGEAGQAGCQSPAGYLVKSIDEAITPPPRASCRRPSARSARRPERQAQERGQPPRHAAAAGAGGPRSGRAAGRRRLLGIADTPAAGRARRRLPRPGRSRDPGDRGRADPTKRIGQQVRRQDYIRRLLGRVESRPPRPEKRSPRGGGGRRVARPRPRGQGRAGLRTGNDPEGPDRYVIRILYLSDLAPSSTRISDDPFSGFGFLPVFPRAGKGERLETVPDTFSGPHAPSVGRTTRNVTNRLETVLTPFPVWNRDTFSGLESGMGGTMWSRRSQVSAKKIFSPSRIHLQIWCSLPLSTT